MTSQPRTVRDAAHGGVLAQIDMGLGFVCCGGASADRADIWRPTPPECMAICLEADPCFGSSEPGLGAPCVEHFASALDSDRFELFASVGVLVVMERRWDVCWEVHVAAAPASRGPGLVDVVMRACGAVAARRGARHFVAPVPSKNRPAAHLAVACGFTREGVLRGAFRGAQGADNIVLFGRDWD